MGKKMRREMEEREHKRIVKQDFAALEQKIIAAALACAFGNCRKDGEVIYRGPLGRFLLCYPHTTLLGFADHPKLWEIHGQD